jgi:uncharacterized protein YraI
MRRLTFGLAAAVAGFVVAPNLASALSALVTEPTELRAGPAYDFPVVDSIPADVRVDVHGCVRAYRWCDVSWRDARGWVPGNELAYLYQGRRVTIVDYGPRIGLPIVVYAFDTYWDRYYRGRPWYGERARWRTVWREHERGDRRTGERIRDGREGRTGERIRDGREGRTDRRTERRDFERTDRNRELERTDRTRERADRTRERTERGREERRREAERPNRAERPNLRTGRGDMERGESRGYNPSSNRGPRQDMDRGPRPDANPGRGQSQPSMGPRGGGGERAGGGERGGGGDRGGGGREERRGN